MKKRFRLTVSILAAAALALTACTAPASSGSTGSSGEAAVQTEAAAASEIGAEVEVDDSRPLSVDGVRAAEVAIASPDPTSFMPLKTTGGGKYALIEIYEALCDKDGFGGDLYGVIAKDWEMDGNELYVTIYDYIYDSAGNHITADDVVFSYDYSWSQGYTTSKYLDYTDGVEKVDDYQIVFHWKEDQIDTYDAIDSVLYGQYIFSQTAYEASPDGMATTPVGTGPYVLEEFTPGNQAVLTRRDDYWQTEESLIAPQHKANVETITYKFITDAAQIVNALKTGDIDYADTVDEAGVASFEGQSDSFGIEYTYDHRVFGAFFNCLEGTPFNDINLRAAICYAVNNEDVVAAVGGEYYARKIYEYCVPGVKSYNTDCETWDSYNNITDLDLAKQYAADSGYNGEVIKIYYYAGEYPTYNEAISLVIGAAMDQLGISYEITAYNQTEDLIATVNSDWDIWVTNVGGTGNAVDYLRANFNPDYFEGTLVNCFDDGLNELFYKTYSASGAVEENVSEFNKYVMDNYYVYGMIERVCTSVYNSAKIADPTVRNQRTWLCPGAWTYYVD